MPHNQLLSEPFKPEISPKCKSCSCESTVSECKGFKPYFSTKKQNALDTRKQNAKKNA